MATDHNFKVKKGLHVLGSEGIYLTDTNTRLHEVNGNALRISTGTGYVDLGSMNSSWVHFQANKNIYILPSTHVSVDGHLYPYTDSTRTLGGNTVRWSHTYTDNITVTDDVTIGGTISSGAVYITSDSSTQRALYIDQASDGTGNIIQFRDENNANIWEVVGRDSSFYIYKNTGTGSGTKYQINTSGVQTFTGSQFNFSGGFVAVDDRVDITSTSGNGGIRLISTNTAVSYVDFGDPQDSNIGLIAYDHSVDNMFFKTNASEAMRIDVSGEVLVGKTSANNTAAGHRFNPSGFVSHVRSGNEVMILNRLSSDGSILTFRKDGATIGQIGTVDSDLTIYTTGSGHKGLRFGNGYVAPTDNTGTTTDNTTDLGLSSQRFKDLHLSGTANVGNINTGQGATEVYLMNQNIRSSDSPTFADLTVTGNLNITGDINSYNVTDLDVSDKTITLGVGQTEANSGSSGIIIDGSGASMLWDEGDNRFEFNKNIYAPIIYGSGAGITALNASQLASGTIPDARIPSLNTSKITAGTFADARISSSSVTQHLGGYVTTAYTGFDSRYYTESEMQTYFRRGYIEFETASGLAAGWYTVATNTGDRAIGDFTLWDTDSGDHQGIQFKASHFYGVDNSNDITVLHYAKYSGSPIRYIRIKDGGTYDGAALQVYIDKADNTVGIAITGGNPSISGWVLKDWIADATDPGDLSSYSSMGERVRVDLDLISNGGQQTSGAVIIGNPSNVLSDTNLSIYQDSSTADQIKFYDGTTRVGEIGTGDTTWLRINNVTNKNIYTPRYIRADNGFFVGNTNTGLTSSGNLIGIGTIGCTTITTTGLTANYNSTANISLSPTSTGGVINARNSSGTSVVVMDGRGTPFIDVTGNLKTGGNTRIDSSGNLTNIGTISSGAITSSGNIAISAGNKIQLSGSGDQTHHIYHNSSTDYDTVSYSTGFKLEHYTSGAQFTLVGSTGNATFAGTISSGRVTTSEDLRFSGTPRIRAENSIAFLTNAGAAQVGKFKAVAAQTSYANGASDGMFNALNGYAVGTGNGQTVIDSNRNITNIVGGEIGNSTDSRGVLTVNHNTTNTTTNGAGTGADISDSNRALTINNPNNNGTANNYAALSFNLNPTTSAYRCMADIKLLRTTLNSSVNDLVFTQKHSDGTFYNNLVINSGGDISTRGDINLADGKDITLGTSNNANGKINLGRGGYITFYGDDNTHHSIGSRNNAGSITDDLTISSYGAVYIDLDSNNNNTTEADFIIGSHGSTTPLYTMSGETGNITTTGTIQNGSVWINDGTNYNNYDENIRLFNPANNVSVIAFSATGTGGVPTTSILGYSDRFETRVGSTWRTRVYSSGLYVNGGYYVGTTAVIDSSGNLVNIGSISASNNIKVESGSNQVLLNTDGAVEITRSAGNPYIDFKNSTSDDYDQRLQINSGNFNFSAPLQVAGTTFIDTSLNLSNIGTISSGAITSTGYLRTSNNGIYGKMSDEWHTANALRGGNFSADIGNDTTVLKLFPASPHDESGNNRAANDYNTGIAFMHLDPDNSGWGSGYTGAQAWIGLKVDSLPGQELDSFVIATNGSSTAGTMPTERFKITSTGAATFTSSLAANSLSINGQQVINSSRQISNVGTISTGIHTINGSQYNPYMNFNVSGVTRGRIGVDDTTTANIYFSNSSSSTSGIGLRIEGYINTNKIIPCYGDGTETNNLTDFGSSGARWKNIYAGSNIYAGADVVAYSSSDERLKDNLERIQQPIEKIQKISGYEFDWNDNQDTFEGHDIGVVAQEVEKVLPEIVETRENGYKAVKYEKMVALLIEGMKEQQEQIKELQEQVQELSKQK